MKRAALAICCGAWLVFGTLADSPSAQAARRTLFASVLDSSGAPLDSVNPADLTVREDKVVREVLEVWPATEPMEIAILIDNSQASDSFIRNYRDALPAFIEAIGADPTGAKHQVAIITLADRPIIAADYTTDLPTAIKATQRIFAMPGSGTYLLDAIIQTSRGISKRSAARSVIIVLTTEGPEMSDRPYQTVIEPLRAAGAALHAIVVGRPVNNQNERAVVLGMGTKDTGGSYINLLTGTALPNAMKRLATELTHQVKVIYSRPQTLIPPDQVTIAAARAGITVRGIPSRTQDQR